MRDIYLTMKLSPTGRQLNGACGQSRAHLGGFDYPFQLAMINNVPISWKFASDSTIYALGGSDTIRFNQCTWLNGERLLKRKQYGLTSRIWFSETNDVMTEWHDFITTLNIISWNIGQNRVT